MSIFVAEASRDKLSIRNMIPKFDAGRKTSRDANGILS
jgi:hypothetical protein